jgi:TPR repeat protein
MRLLRPLAEQGDADAQFNLGVMYAKGQGVRQNYVLAHMWINLAGASGLKEAMTVRDELAKLKMTPAQIAEAQKLAREWKPK